MTQTDDYHLAATQAFINENPDDIVLMRAAKVAQPSGGWRLGPPAPLASQVMRKVALNRVTAAVERVLPDGRTVHPTFTLIAMPDADIEAGDTFTLDGAKHEVVYVGDRPRWRLSAEVVVDGS